MPDTKVAFAPAWVVNLAERQFSGTSEALMEDNDGACGVTSCSMIVVCAGSVCDGTWTSYSAIIRSANLRRSDDRSGDRFLTCGFFLNIIIGRTLQDAQKEVNKEDEGVHGKQTVCDS